MPKCQSSLISTVEGKKRWREGKKRKGGKEKNLKTFFELVQLQDSTADILYDNSCKEKKL